MISNDLKEDNMCNCRYCSFSRSNCIYYGNDDCPLTQVDDQLAECWDVECGYYENSCDYCFAYKETSYDDYGDKE